MNIPCKFFAALLMVVALRLPAAAQETPPVVVISRCLVQVIEEIDVPAEDAGVVMQLDVREGSPAHSGKVLGKINNKVALARVSAATARHDRAKSAAENDVNKRYAEAAKNVAYLNYVKSQEANDKRPGSVSQTEIRSLALTWKRAELQVEQSEHEQDLATQDVAVAAAELDAAKLEIERRQIKINGRNEDDEFLVVEARKRPGAWVTAGDTILKVIRMNKLRVVGHVNAANYGPQEINGMKVRVKVRLERGREEEFNGQVTFVNPVQVGGDYAVWAEVTNKHYSGSQQWMLRPGMNAEMTIELEDTSRVSRFRR